jgi:hypothetical protein
MARDDQSLVRGDRTFARQADVQDLTHIERRAFQGLNDGGANATFHAYGATYAPYGRRRGLALWCDNCAGLTVKTKALGDACEEASLIRRRVRTC